MANVRLVAITYDCNRNCSYCYAKNLNKQFPQQMSLKNFSKILDWFEKQNIKLLHFIGGEPTIHPQLIEFINMIKDRGFRFNISTNGLFKDEKTLSAFADSVFCCSVNYNPPEMYSHKDRKLIEKNIRGIREVTERTRLCINLLPNSKNIDYIINDALKYNIKYVNCDPCYPNLENSNVYAKPDDFISVGKKIVRIVESCIENDLHPEVDVPIPLCSLNIDDRLFLMRNLSKLSSQCQPSSNVYMINPDLSLFPCTALHIKSPTLDFFPDESSIEKFYKKTTENLKWNVKIFAECKNCIYFKRKKCQGGCLTYKYLKSKSKGSK